MQTPHTPLFAPSALDVLVVEDDRLNLAVALRVLGRAGHRVSAARDGRAALLAVQRHRYDVVLMDVEMPEMDGVETTKAIRAGGCQVRIIALTGHAGPEQARRCREAGMDDVLVKPIDLRKIDSTLRGATPTQSEVQALPVVDLDAVMARLGGDGELAFEVAEIVREEAPKLLAQLVQHVNEELGDEAVLSAHSMKGALSNVNARATQIAASIERLTRRGDWPSARILLGDLTLELKTLDTALVSAMSRLDQVKLGVIVPLNEQESENAAARDDRGRFSNRPATGG